MSSKPKRIEWIEEYHCGCSSSAEIKKYLLGYCSKHGDSIKRIYKIQVDKEPPK